MVEDVKGKKPSNPAGVPVWSHDGIVCIGDALKNSVRLTFPKGVVARDLSFERPTLDEADNDLLGRLSEAQPPHDGTVVDRRVQRRGAELIADGEDGALRPAVLVKVVVGDRNPTAMTDRTHLCRLIFCARVRVTCDRDP